MKNYHEGYPSSFARALSLL